MQPSTPSVSIIVPVKNALPYLDECLNSISSQSLDDWELICIDDGSTDGSSRMLDEFASAEPRASVIHQICGDAGSARNLGLSMARGEYVAFLDADDFFEAPMLEEALTRARRYHADVVVFGGRRFDNQTQKLSGRLQFVNTKLVEKECFNRYDCPRNLFRTTYPGPCAKLFRRSFINKNELEFQQLPNAEDLSFSLSAVALADRIVAFNGDFLRYRVNTPSSNESTKSTQPLCFLDALLDLKERLERAGVFELLHEAYNEQVLSTTRYNLDTVSTDSARQTILDALTLPPFADLDLLFHDKDWYSSTYAFECARYLEAALRQRKTLRIESEGFATDESFACVTPCRAQKPPLISVVIPVFNTGYLVRETLDSVCAQTAEDIEVICIDDGSTDNSLDILTDYAASDPRISVYHQDNRGLGATRNAGQAVARGTYLSFIDSDDLIAEGAYQTCLEHLEQDELDMVIFDAESFYESPELEEAHPTFRTYYARRTEYSEPRSGARMLRVMVEEDDYKPTTWLYMVKRQLLIDNNIHTHPGIIHEDNGFTFRVLCHARRVAHIQQPLYLRRVREDSIMTTPKSFANVYGYYMCALDMLDDIYSNSSIKDSDAVDSALQLVFRVQHNARGHYSEIPEYELGALKALPAAAAKALTTAMDASLISRRAHNLINKRENDAQRIRDSRAYRLGNILAAPVRFLRSRRR